MKFEEIELPSNRKFGYFFAFIFGVVAVSLFAIGSLNWGYTFSVLSVLFVLITVAKADLLLPLNKLWIHLGLLLGMIIGPIVLGIIFFGLFTPIAFMMRLFGRVELCLKIHKDSSYWSPRRTDIDSESFKNQF